MDQSVTDEIMLQGFQSLPLIKDSCSVSLDDIQNYNPVSLRVYPNPMIDFSRVESSIPGGVTRVELFDPLGRVIWHRNMGKLTAGQYSWEITNQNYPAGNYYVRIQCGPWQKLELLQIYR
jgi:hypothetical protein